MAEDETIFDASLKKKKKKKTGFNLESIDVTSAADQQENGNVMVVDESVDDVELLGKKKKKKVPFNMDDIKDSLSDGVDEVSKNTINIDDMDMDFSKMKKKPKMKNKVAPVLEDVSEEKIKDDADIGEFDGELIGKKKKKKSNALNVDDLDGLYDNNDINTSSMNIEDMDFSKMKKKPKTKLARVGIDDLHTENKSTDSMDGKENEDSVGWMESDRDYTYDELYQRSFNILKEKNPDMATGEKKKFVMKPPRVMRIGSKKTAFANFNEICKLLHRMPKHLLQFLLAELGTSGSIDGNSQLIIKGRFQQKQIENVLKRYIKEYVTCHTCKSPNTILQKDARLYFLQCEQCNSRCSVAPIKSGFQAVANKQQRQAIRASKN